jgi:hypothetical protein
MIAVVGQATTGAGMPPQAATGTVGLGNNADFTLTPLSDIHETLPPPSTVKNWHLRSLGREILKKNGVERRMRWCGSRISRGGDGVSLYARPDRPYGRVGGVCVCGQSVCCPVCAPRIAAFRAAEVAEAFQRARNAGWEVGLETFTKPHQLDRRPDALAREIRSFSSLWETFQHNRSRREKGHEGHHVGREVNWGSNGWHYHFHRLRYDRPGTFEPLRARAQWLAALESDGLRSEGADTHAYDFGAIGDEAGARYIAKVSTAVEAQARAIGSEIASSATKGRNLNTLLAHHAAGDLEAGQTWLNGVCCVTALKVSSVRWSRKLRWKLGLDAEKSDEEIAAEEILPTDELLGALNPWQWQGVLKWRAEFALLCAANRGRDAVNEFLTGLNLGLLDDRDPRAVWRETANKEGF